MRSEGGWRTAAELTSPEVLSPAGSLKDCSNVLLWRLPRGVRLPSSRVPSGAAECISMPSTEYVNWGIKFPVHELGGTYSHQSRGQNGGQSHAKRSF